MDSVQKVRKAVIPAAGRGTRLYPASTTVQKEMFPLVDRDGIAKPVIQLIVEEALESGIEEICIVTPPGRAELFRQHFEGLPEDLLPLFSQHQWALEQSERLKRIQPFLSYTEQPTPEGSGHALYCARDFVGDEPFLWLLSDHVYLSASAQRCARQALDVYNRHGCTVTAVKQTPTDLLRCFGTLTGNRIADEPPTYEVTNVIEKPPVEQAYAQLRAEGVPDGMFLCFFGIYVFTPGIFDCLRYNIDHDIRQDGEFQLTAAQDMLRARERYLAFEANGQRYDMGVPFGLAETQMALALSSPLRDQMLGSPAQTAQNPAGRAR